MAPGTTWKPVLSDPVFETNPGAREKVSRVCFVSGKLYYDLVKARESKQLVDKVALVRVEELNPFPTSALQIEIAKFKNCNEFYWVQEEPENQGAYQFMAPRLSQLIPSKLYYHGRKPSAAPATGISKVYKKEQDHVINGVFNL
jgi:probable 2-oxoglutarate dehydrogenase E1 component DHKTD1